MPEFKTDEDHSYFISRFYIHEAFLNDTTPKMKNKNPYSLSTPKAILDLINQNPKITRVEIAERISITWNGVKYHINLLKKKKNKTYWVFKIWRMSDP